MKSYNIVCTKFNENKIIKNDILKGIKVLVWIKLNFWLVVPIGENNGALLEWKQKYVKEFFKV